MNIADELYKWADQLSEQENKFGVVVRALVASLRRAANTIWQLHDNLQKAKADNVKLQNDADLLRAMLSQVQTEKQYYMADNIKLQNENLKLRKYASKALLTISYCDCCPYIDCGCDTETVPMHDGCKAFEELRELGVKVDLIND